MKNFKRTVAAVMTSALLLTPCVASMSMNAFAAGESIKITNPVDDHVYTAYQVFDGTLGEGKVLSDISWGNGVDGSTILSKIKTDDTFKISGTNIFASATDAKTVASALAANSANLSKDQMDKFATIVYANITKAGATKYTVTGIATNVDPGYYVVVDTAGEDLDATADNVVYSRYMLDVAGPVEIYVKTTLPTLDKTFADGTTANTAAIGDTIEYKITAKIPDMTGYDKYYFIINDTMDSSLKFKSRSLKVYVGDPTAASTSWTEIVKNDSARGDWYFKENTDNSFKVVMEDFIQYKDSSYAGKYIIVTYGAELLSTADLTANGNKNTADLTYSNNPNVDYDGWYNDNPTDSDHPTPDDPSDDTPKTPGGDVPSDRPVDPPTGDTPDKTVKTYTTQLEVFKREGGTTNGLKGAAFTLYKYTGATTNKTDITADTENWSAGTAMTVAENGYTFSTVGLDVGWYKIVETTTPDKYNSVSDVVFQITANVDNTKAGWAVANNTDVSFTEDSGSGESLVAGKVNTIIDNFKGSTLPSTGGIGTTLFYVIGGMLVVGSSVVLVTKKRMSAEKK